MYMKLNDLKPLERNPFKLKGDAELETLKKNIQGFEKMLSIRKIVIDENNTIWGGNKRYFALKSLGYKEIPDEWIDKRTDLTEEEKKKFAVLDNVGFGEWQIDILQEWDVPFAEWGVDVVEFGEDEEIDFDNITSNEARNVDKKSKEVTCPKCLHKFEV